MNYEHLNKNRKDHDKVFTIEGSNQENFKKNVEYLVEEYIIKLQNNYNIIEEDGKYYVKLFTSPKMPKFKWHCPYNLIFHEKDIAYVKEKPNNKYECTFVVTIMHMWREMPKILAKSLLKSKNENKKQLTKMYK